jgi:hypothetical protein
MGINLEVSLRGAIISGEAEEAAQRYARHMEDVLGDKAVTDIRAYLPTQYMYLGHHGGTPESNPVPQNAGALTASVVAERQSENEVMVLGDRVTYGAWIEGDTSLNMIVYPHRRNPPPRRFPGYHAFRLVAQLLQGQAEEIALAELPPYLEEMRS